MGEATPNPPKPTAQVTDALRRNRRPIAAGLGICAVALVAALAMPVGLPDAATRDARGPLGGDSVAVAAVEDLAAFAASRRWGGDTFSELDARRRAAEADATADAARRDRMGFVGTSATPDDRAVLLTLPGGEVRRVSAGGTLPDGRTVSDATDTTATLSDTGSREELELFPRPSADGEETVRETRVPSGDPAGEGRVPGPAPSQDPAGGTCPLPSQRPQNVKREDRDAARRPRAVTKQHCRAPSAALKRSCHIDRHG